MLEQKTQISETQNLALELLNDPQIVDLLFGGGAGGAKSFLVCLWMVMECRNYPGIHNGLGRKEMKRLKETTLVTLLSKVHPAVGVRPHEFEYNDHKGVVRYANGSQIQLIDMARQPSDPEYDTFGSLEFTHVVIEEVGEVVKKAVDVLTSRKNRFLNKQYGIVGKTILTTNPTQNFIRGEYYEPYKALGAGRYQKWESGVVELPDGEIVPAYKAFIRSLAADNPFVDRNYIEELRRKPPAERKRLLEGNWDYLDDDWLLFPALRIDQAMISEVGTGKKFMGVDIADTGKDKTVIGQIDNGVLVDQQRVTVDVSGEKAVSEATALEIIKYAQTNGIGARDIGIDGVGVGVGVRDFLRSKGWFVQVFIAGASPMQPGYQNMRSEQYWETSEDMDNGALKIYRDLPFLTELRQELLAHEFASAEKVIKVQPKDKVKEKLGHSPDFADAVVIARWVANGKSDSRHNTNRLRF